MRASLQGTTPAFALEEYAGRYSQTMYSDREITQHNGVLRLTFGPVYKGPCEHRHYETFQVNWDEPGFGYVDVLFLPGFDGKISSLKWSGAGEFLKKKKE